MHLNKFVILYMIIEAEEAKKEEEEWKPYIPSEPSPILYGFHSSEQGKFWLSMVGWI